MSCPAVSQQSETGAVGPQLAAVQKKGPQYCLSHPSVDYALARVSTDVRNWTLFDIENWTPRVK
jgi:hypothetical protein